MEPINNNAEPKLSATTLACLDTLLDVLEVLHDCLDDDDLRPQFGSLVEQAVARTVPAEERKYRIVKVGSDESPR